MSTFGAFVCMVCIDGVIVRATSFSAEQQTSGGRFNLKIDFPIVTGGEHLHQLLTSAVLFDDAVSHVDAFYTDGISQRFEKIRGVKSRLCVSHGEHISVHATLTGECIDFSPPQVKVDYLKPARVYTWNDATAFVDTVQPFNRIEGREIRSVSATVERDEVGIKESGHVTILGERNDFDMTLPGVVHIGYHLQSGRFNKSYDFQCETPNFTQSRVLDDKTRSSVFETKLTWKTR